MKVRMMMKRDLDANVYVATVDHRLQHLQKYLGDFRQGKFSSVVLPLWNLRALQDEMRLAGHRDLAELCRWMERGIMRLQMGKDEDPERLAAEIATVSEHIKRGVREAYSGPDMPAAKHPERLSEVSIA